MSLEEWELFLGDCGPPVSNLNGDEEAVELELLARAALEDAGGGADGNSGAGADDTDASRQRQQRVEARREAATPGAATLHGRALLDWRAAACHPGCLGVVCELEVDVVPAYDVHQRVLEPVERSQNTPEH